MRILVGSYPARRNKARTFVRPLRGEERQALEKGRESAAALTVRRPQIPSAGAARMAPAEIVRVVGGTAQAVRNPIRAFGADGRRCRVARSRARKNPGRVWDRGRDNGRKGLPHRRPRELGKRTRRRTPALAAEVCHEKGWAPRPLSIAAIRRT